MSLRRRSTSQGQLNSSLRQPASLINVNLAAAASRQPCRTSILLALVGHCRSQLRLPVHLWRRATAAAANTASPVQQRWARHSLAYIES